MYIHVVCVCVPAGYGVSTDGHTMFINCSTCNLAYQPLNPPIIFDLPNRT